MQKSKAVHYRNIFLLLILFIIVLFIGRYIERQQQSNLSSNNQSTTTPENNLNSGNVQSPPSSISSSTSSSLGQSDELTSCAQSLQSQAQKDNTQYESGSLIVTFNLGVTFADAKQIITSYGGTIADPVLAQENYPQHRLLTAHVKNGEEFSKICQMRQDSRIHYVGLNVIFSLHQ